MKSVTDRVFVVYFINVLNPVRIWRTCALHHASIRYQKSPIVIPELYSRTVELLLVDLLIKIL